MGNEIIPINDQGFVYNDYSTLELISQKILNSGITKLGNVTQIALVIVRGRNLGLDLFISVENIFVVNNQTCVRGDLAMALVERSGLFVDKEHVFEGEGMNRTCTVTVQRKDRTPKSWSFSMANAKQAGLLDRRGGNWQTFPDSMLYYRALGFALRREFPDVLFGMHLIEEFDDDDAMPASKKQEKLKGKPVIEMLAGEEKKQEEKPEPMEPEKPPRDPFPQPPAADGDSPQGQLLARAQQDGIDENALVQILQRLKHGQVEHLAELPADKAKLFLNNWDQIKHHSKVFYPELWGTK
jgi:hypothetical protein